MPFDRIRPTAIRLEASSACQLRCPSCPAHSGAVRPALRNGFLTLSAFESLIQANPQLKRIELSNYGEILLNPDLLGIPRCAHERGVSLTADNGVNFNTVSDELLEGLIRYELRSMTCSIDGASEETYALYRVNGSFSTVIENIRKLNKLKEAHLSEFPRLTWQFVVLGHNEHELPRAREMARALGMEFRAKLSWDPLFSPVRDEEFVRMELGAADRGDYQRRFGIDYARRCCFDLWRSPQINWDGTVLGCSRNFWGDFGANAFSDGLVVSVNSPGMRRARQMLLGKKPARTGIPCATCSTYSDMLTGGRWLTRSEVRSEQGLSIRDRCLAKVRKTPVYPIARRVYRFFKPRRPWSPRLTSGIYPLEIPLAPDEERGWRSQGVFSGSTERLFSFTCHASVLTKGTCPHPPHAHQEEEILLLFCGEADLTLVDGSQVPREEQQVHLQPGQFVYYPAGFAHTLRTTSEQPADYLMLKWFVDGGRAGCSLPHGLFEVAAQEGEPGAPGGFTTRMLFEGPTQYLRRLHCHATTLSAGRGYEPHEDAYDVVIVVLEGELETLGKKARPNDVIFYATGDPHGMYNPGPCAAKYLVFEFHGRQSGLKAWAAGKRWAPPVRRVARVLRIIGRS